MTNTQEEVDALLSDVQLTSEVVSDPPVTPEPIAEPAPAESEHVETVPEQPEVPQIVEQATTLLDLLMAKIGSVETHTKYLKILVYGMPGTRKTVFTATAPAPLIVDIEKGAHSIRNHPELSKNVKVLEFKSIKQAEVLLDYLGQTPVPEQLADRKTLVIDSFSELSKRDLDEILGDAASKDASRNKYLPTGPDYNISTEHMRQFASKLRDLPMHVIVTCHVKEEKDESTGRLLVRPNLTPKLAGTLAGMFDVVGYMQLDNDTAKLQVHPTNTVTAKTRVGGLPAIIENPTFSSILDAFQKGLNK
jgi:phage nucleotide-binding protein